jgi:hypothetical protein
MPLKRPCWRVRGTAAGLFCWVGRLPAVSTEIQTPFLNVWIESKTLALRGGDRPVLAKVLRMILMPGAAIQLYRGEVKMDVLVAPQPMIV